MYKSIIFDFFDVIHEDPFKQWLRASKIRQSQKYRQISSKVDKGEISELEFYQQLSASSGQALADIKKSFNSVNSVDLELLELIKRLHNYYKIGLLSNSSSEYIRPIIKKYNLDLTFDAIVISAEIKSVKPSNEAFTHILGLLRSQPSQTVFIDDNKTNVIAAKNLGMTTHLYKNIYALKQFFNDQSIMFQ